MAVRRLGFSACQRFPFRLQPAPKACGKRYAAADGMDRNDQGYLGRSVTQRWNPKGDIEKGNYTGIAFRPRVLLAVADPVSGK